MKKIKIIATVIFLILVFSRKSLAASAYTSEEIRESFIQYIYDKYGISVNTEGSTGTQNLSRLNDFCGYWRVEDDKHCIMFQDSDGFINFAVVNSYNLNGTSVSFDYLIYNSYRPNIGAVINPAYSGSFTASFTPNSFNDLGNLNEFMNPIDYENYVYDPTIYVPNIKAVYTGNNPSQAASSYSIPVDFTIDNGTGVEYGIQIQYKFWMPKLVKFIYSDGGSVNYAYANYSGHFNDLYEMGSGETIEAAENGEIEYLTFNLLDNINDWVNFHSSVMLNQSYESNVTDYSSSQSAYTRFNKNVLKMGNRLELWVRYYYVVDGIVYAGDWRHWISEAPQEQDLVQSVQYVTGSNVSANSNQVNPSDQEISQELESPTSVLPSYQNVQVTVINQVPNNMNYPTIAAYQNDNMLVDTMNNATKIMNWLNGEGEFAQAGMTGASNGGFGAFLGASFGFIPWYIWAVIAVGFGFSIVIMILKVL